MKDKTGRPDTWEFYKDAEKEWRWKRRASNGELVSASSEGYKRKRACEANAKRNGYVKPE